MLPITQGPRIEARRPGFSWGLLALALGAIALITIALLTIPLAARPPELAPTSTPDGVVQRFYDAAYRGDYVAAYAMLSEDTRRELSLAEFQARMRYERESELRVNDVALHGETATVTVTITYYSPGGLFGGGEWSTQYDILLEREGDTWRILGQPF